MKKGIVIFVLLLCVLIGGLWFISNNLKSTTEQQVHQSIEAIPEPYDGLINVSAGQLQLSTVTIGTAKIGNLVLTSTAKPQNPTAGQIYFDQSTKELNYYNGQTFVALTKVVEVQTPTQSTGQTTTIINRGTDLLGSSLAQNGLLIGQGTSTVAVVVASGPGLCLQSTSGAPEFSACPSGGGGSGVTSLNGLTGVLSVANASGSGGVVTIDNASTSQKGIAQFNNLNFSASSGTINTIQDIATSASPTFTNATLSGDLAVNGSDITSTGALVLKPSGANNIILGTSDTTGTLLILDTKTGAGDPTGVLGAMYFNSSSGKFRCFELDQGSAGYWRDCSMSARTAFYYTNDMLSTANDNNIKFDAQDGGGFDADELPEAGRPGIVESGTGTTTNGWAYVGQNTNQNQDILFGAGSWRYETGIKLPSASSDLSTVSDRYNIRLGFHKNPISDASNTDGCWLRYSDNINSGEWEGVCAAGGTTTVCDTNVPVALDTWYRATINVNANATSADFQINGTSRCQVASNIPTTGSGTGWANSINKTAGTNGRSILQDYVEVYAQLTTSR